MMKYLLVALVVIIAVGIWRNTRRKPATPAPHVRKKHLREPEDMVTCAHCGLHLPASDALKGDQQLHYCSIAHRQLGPRQ